MKSLQRTAEIATPKSTNATKHDKDRLAQATAVIAAICNSAIKNAIPMIVVCAMIGGAEAQKPTAPPVITFSPAPTTTPGSASDDSANKNSLIAYIVLGVVVLGAVVACCRCIRSKCNEIEADENEWNADRRFVSQQGEARGYQSLNHAPSADIDGDQS